MKAMTQGLRAATLAIGTLFSGAALADGVLDDLLDWFLPGSSFFEVEDRPDGGGARGEASATLSTVTIVGVSCRTNPYQDGCPDRQQYDQYFGNRGGSGGARDYLERGGRGGNGGASSSQGNTSANRLAQASEDNAPTDDCRTNPTTGNPVVIATGEKVQTEQDFNDFGDAGLGLTRIYRSNTSLSGLFGSKWRSSLDFPKVQFDPVCYPSKFGCMPEEISVSRPDGARKSYMLVSLQRPTYRPVDTGSDGTGWGSLAWSVSTTSVTIDEKKFTYQSSTGRLTQIDRAGTVLYTFNYGPSGLSTITHRSGRAVQFTWSGGLVSQVADPAGDVWTYKYDAAGNLISATPPGGSNGAKVYHYENTANPSLLTGISIDGVRSTRNTYDSANRVTRSAKENGETFEAFAYAGNATTVTDAMGQSVTYNFESYAGAKRLLSISRASTSTCAAAAASQAYDANGYLDYTLDWNGVKTDYTYNANGQLLEVIHAAGTPEAFRQTNTWATGTLLQESLVYGRSGTAFRRIAYTYDAKWLPTSITVTDLRTGQVRTTTIAYTFHANNVMASRTATVSMGGTSPLNQKNWWCRRLGLSYFHFSGLGLLLCSRM